MDRREQRDKKIHIILMTGMIAIMLAGLGVVAYAVMDSRNVQIPEMPTQIQGAEGIGEVKELPEFMKDKIDKNDLESLKP